MVRKQQLLDGAASGPTAEGGQRVFGIDRKGPKIVFLKIISYIAKMLYIARDHDQAEGQCFHWFERYINPKRVQKFLGCTCTITHAGIQKNVDM